MLEQVVLTIGGRVLSHTGCRLQASPLEVSRDASFEVAYNGPGVPCQEDEEATITVSGELWLTGYTRDINADHDEQSRTYSVTVVSKTVDAQEASIDHPTGFKKDCDLKEIAE